MGWLAKKVTQLYNRGIQERNRVVKQRAENKRKEADFNRQLETVRQTAYEKERVKMAYSEGRQRAHKGRGGAAGTMMNIGRGFSKASDEFVKDFVLPQAPRKKKKKKQSVNDFLL